MTSDGGQTFTTLQLPTAQIGAKGWEATAVRFANATDGWAFGDDDNFGPALFTTTDGGLSWSELQMPGRVIDLVAANGKAWAVVDMTPANTIQPPTEYGVFMTSYGQAAEQWNRVTLPIDLGNATPSIVDQDGTVTVLSGGPRRSSDADHSLISVAGAPFVDHTGPCFQEDGGYLSNSAKAIWATCPTGTAEQLAVSTNSGATWKSVPFTSTLPDTESGGLAAIDNRTAVVYDGNQAIPSLTGLLTVSASGSVVRRTAEIDQPSFVGFTTPQIGFAIDTHLWRTTDGGVTWSMVQL